MQNQKTLILGIIVAGGILTAFWSLHDQQEREFSIVIQNGRTIVDGVEAPQLSELPFHMSFVDDGTCLQCHRKGKTLTVRGTTYDAPKIKHDIRQGCNRCHQLPKPENT
ncbi:MAG: hypothetical protein ACE5D8_06690 [Fidelibacterota bacterium]